MTFGSLFAGIGGPDCGLERAGLECRWQVEIDTACLTILKRHWPEVPKYHDIRELVDGEDAPEAVDLICGGDPCPAHSRARSNGPSKHADLSGYFLAVVERLRPWWVVRENVPAPTVAHFDAALAALGYGTVIVRVDAAEITGQSRQRDFVVGKLEATRESLTEVFSFCGDGQRASAPRYETEQVAPCLTTHPQRYDSRDCFIWEADRGLRILEGSEREALAGFPEGWAAGFSETTLARFYGNAVVPQVAEWLGRQIVKAEARIRV